MSMNLPPTWRDLGRRARRLGMTLSHGPHDAMLFANGRMEMARVASWLCRRADAIILRTAVAAALEQLYRRR